MRDMRFPSMRCPGRNRAHGGIVRRSLHRRNPASAADDCGPHQLVDNSNTGDGGLY